MPGNKYVAIISGRKQEVAAVQSSAGAGDAGKIVGLNSAGQIDQTMMPTGIGPDTSSFTASEALSAGDPVNIWDDAGTLKARKADATTSGKEADGFVLSGASLGASALVYFEGKNTALSALTPGARYYLSTTAGTVTTTPPSASGNVVQYLGRAISTTTISWEADDGVILA